MNAIPSNPNISAVTAKITPKTSAETITQRIVDATVDNTLAGTDRLVGSVAGLGTAAAGYLSKMPGAFTDVVKSANNLFHSETIGPNIKVLAALGSPLIVAGGLIGAGLGLVVSAASGAIKGAQAHDSEKPREFTIGKAVDQAWTKTREGVKDTTSELVKGTQETREKKLAPGEDPWDIPLPPFGRTAKTVAATVAGVIIGGVGGLVTAVAVTAKGMWDGIVRSSEKGHGPNTTLSSWVGAPVTGAVHGLEKVFTTPVKAAAAAWKEKSLGSAVKAAVNEAFGTKPDAFSSAAGAAVGGTFAAAPSAITTAIVTTASELAKGLGNAVTDEDLNLGAKALAVAGTLVGAPIAGAAHGVATAVTTPLRATAVAWDKSSMADGVATGIIDGVKSTKGFSNGAGTFVGGLAVGGISAVAATSASAVSGVFGGLIDVATNSDLNASGKVLAGLGGLPGDVITAVGQGIGTLGLTPVRATGEALEKGSLFAGIKSAAQYGTKAVQAAAHPNDVLVETVPVEPKQT